MHPYEDVRNNKTHKDVTSVAIFKMRVIEQFFDTIDRHSGLRADLLKLNFSAMRKVSEIIFAAVGVLHDGFQPWTTI
jgi:hypothetical protein